MRRRYVLRPGHPRANERGFVDVTEIGWIEQGPQAINAPIMVDRFMEGASTIDGQDIGSRAKRKEYMRRNGVSDASDVSSKWVRDRREEKERRASEVTRKTVAELSNVDTRNLRNAVEQMRSKK